MPITQQVRVEDLTIDLQNYRTIPQQDEATAIQAMITISPDYFWGLMSSLLDDGYLPTENIIVIDNGKNEKLVKEGNRRIASLKIIHGYISANEFDIPDSIQEKISKLSQNWRDENEMIPCTIYDKKDAATVDKIVTLTHGKGQKAGRDVWEAIARARHNQKANAAPENGLVLLEKYLKDGKNLSAEQKLRWSGKYNLSVLDEALPKIFPRVGCSSTSDFVSKYPSIKYRKEVDEVLLAIGLGGLSFKEIRGALDFLIKYGFSPVNSTTVVATSTASSGGVATSNPTPANPITNPVASSGTKSTSVTTGSNPQAAATVGIDVKPASRVSSTSTHDVKTVRRSLRNLKLYGINRSKLVDIKKEMIELKLDDNPIAFIFLLRCMVELSAKAFCDDKSSEPSAPRYTKQDGKDKPLGTLLGDIVNFLTQNRKDTQMLKLLHGPITEISRPDGLLSIVAMNQLVHNPRFIIRSGDIPGLFSSIFPLIEQMNK